jgi:hypothetical protein
MARGNEAGTDHIQYKEMDLAYHALEEIETIPLGFSFGGQVNPKSDHTGQDGVTKP